jgi:hypothetical protein
MDMDLSCVHAWDYLHIMKSLVADCSKRILIITHAQNAIKGMP